MERLYTPWRRDYVQNSSKVNQECIFCKVEGSNNDPEQLILWVSPRTMVMCNRYPYTNGHLLIAPREHIDDFSILHEEVTREIFRLIQKSITILKKIYSPEGFNIGINAGKAAGAGIDDHIHVHVLPRWAGDTNFMTPVSEVRVLPETVLQTYERLLPEFRILEI